MDFQTQSKQVDKNSSKIKLKQKIFMVFANSQQYIEKYQILYNFFCIIHIIQVWIMLLAPILPSNGNFIGIIKWSNFKQLMNWFYIFHYSQYNYTKDISNLNVLFYLFTLFFYLTLISAFCKFKNLKKVDGYSNKIIICIVILISIMDLLFIPLMNITIKSLQSGGWKLCLTMLIIPLMVVVSIFNRKRRIYNIWFIFIPVLGIYLNVQAFSTIVCLYCLYNLIYNKYTQYNLTTCMVHHHLFQKVGTYIHITSCLWVLRYTFFQTQIIDCDFIWYLIQVLLVSCIVINLIRLIPNIHSHQLYQKNEYLIKRIKLKKKSINIVDEQNYIKLEYLFVSEFSQMSQHYSLYSNYLNRFYKLAGNQLLHCSQDQLSDLIILRTQILARQSKKLSLILQSLRMKIQYNKNIASTIKQALIIYNTQSISLSILDQYQIFKVVTLAIQAYELQNHSQICKVQKIIEIQDQFQTFINLLKTNLQQLIHFWICVKYDIKNELEQSAIRLFQENSKIQNSYQKLNQTLNSQYINAIMQILFDIVNGFKNYQETVKNIKKIQSHRNKQTYINRYSLLKQTVAYKNTHQKRISQKLQNVSYLVIGSNKKITKASVWICKQLKYQKYQLQGKYQYQIWPQKMSLMKDDNQINELKQRLCINQFYQKNTIMVAITDRNGYLVIKNLGVYTFASLLNGIQFIYYFQDIQEMKQKMVALAIEPITNIILGCTPNFCRQFDVMPQITKKLLIQTNLTTVTDIFQGLQFNNFKLVDQKYSTNCFLFTSLFLNKNYTTNYKNCKYKVNVKIFDCIYFKNINILLVKDGHLLASQSHFYSRSNVMFKFTNNDKKSQQQNKFQNQKFYCSIVNPYYNKIANKIQHLQTNKYFKYYFFIKVMVIVIILIFCIMSGFFYYFSHQQIFSHSSNINNIIIFNDEYHTLSQIYRDSLLVYLINQVKITQVDVKKIQWKSDILKQSIQDQIKQFQDQFFQQKSYKKIKTYDEHNFKSLQYSYQVRSPYTFLFDILVNFQKILTLQPDEDNTSNAIYYLIQNYQIYKQVHQNFKSQYLWNSSIFENDLFRYSLLLILLGDSVNLILFIAICILIKSMLELNLQITQIFSFLNKDDVVRVQSFLKTFKASINEFNYLKTINDHSNQYNEQKYQLYSGMSNRTIIKIDIKLSASVENQLIGYMNILLQNKKPINQTQNIKIKTNQKAKKQKINFMAFMRLLIFIILFIQSFYQLYHIYSKQIQVKQIYQYQQFLSELIPRVTLQILQSYYQVIKNQTNSKNKNQAIVKDYQNKYPLPYQLQIAVNNYYIQLFNYDVCNINITLPLYLQQNFNCEEVLGDKIGRNFHRIRQFYDIQLLKLRFKDIIDFVNDTEEKVLLKTLLLQQKLQIKIFQNFQQKIIELYQQYSNNKLNESKNILIASYMILSLVNIYLIFWVNSLKYKSKSGVSLLKIIPLWVIQRVQTLKYIKEKKIINKIQML